jgi:hypothetical protein
VYGGDALCNPLCGGDPCNSIRCPAFQPLCQLASLAECLSGPEALPIPPDLATAFDCLRVYDIDGDGDVDLKDAAKYLFTLRRP